MRCDQLVNGAWRPAEFDGLQRQPSKFPDYLDVEVFTQWQLP